MPPRQEEIFENLAKLAAEPGFAHVMTPPPSLPGLVEAIADLEKPLNEPAV
jgi:hypothetical protein